MYLVPLVAGIKGVVAGAEADADIPTTASDKVSMDLRAALILNRTGGRGDHLALRPLTNARTTMHLLSRAFIKSEITDRVFEVGTMRFIMLA